MSLGAGDDYWLGYCSEAGTQHSSIMKAGD